MISSDAKSFQNLLASAELKAFDQLSCTGRFFTELLDFGLGPKQLGGNLSEHVGKATSIIEASNLDSPGQQPKLQMVQLEKQ